MRIRRARNRKRVLNALGMRSEPNPAAAMGYAEKAIRFENILH